VGSLARSLRAAREPKGGRLCRSERADQGGPAGYEGQFAAYADESQARAALLAKEIDSYFVLPADYVQSGAVLVYSMGGGFSSFVPQTPRFCQIPGRPTLGRPGRPGNPDPGPDTGEHRAVTLDEKGEVDTESAFSWLGDFVVPYSFRSCSS